MIILQNYNLFFLNLFSAQVALLEYKIFSYFLKNQTLNSVERWFPLSSFLTDWSPKGERQMLSQMIQWSPNGPLLCHCPRLCLFGDNKNELVEKPTQTLWPVLSLIKTLLQAGSYCGVPEVKHANECRDIATTHLLSILPDNKN